MTVLQKKPTSPIDHLTDADIEQIGVELDAIRAEFIEKRGASDAAYIRKVIDTQRKLELGSRAVLLFSLFPPAWFVGTAGLSVAKILENMEIGHNVMHGQWDWMRDPKIHSTTWEWDNASPSEQWKHIAQRGAPQLHQRGRQGQRPRLRHHARRRGPALAPDLPRPAAVELHQRLLLRVRHRGVRPRDRQERQAQDAEVRGVQDRGPQDAAQDQASSSPRTTSCTRSSRARRSSTR